jgi:hypothetical protein
MQSIFAYATRGLHICHFTLITAASFAISGGVNAAQVGHPGAVATGHALRKASAMLMLTVFIILVAVIIGILARSNQAWVGDRRILYGAAISFPFLLVRIVYTIILSFDTNSSVFNYTNPNVFVQAFMVSKGIAVCDN